VQLASTAAQAGYHLDKKWTLLNSIEFAALAPARFTFLQDLNINVGLKVSPYQQKN
jgi:hypothetical protein